MTNEAKKQIGNLLTLARANAVRSQKYTDELMGLIKEQGVYPDEVFDNCLKYENANNLEEAILCHISYGECKRTELINDIANAIVNAEEENV